MIFLRYDCQRIASEHFFCPYYGIECPESGKVEDYPLFGNSMSYKGIAHRCRFIIFLYMVVAACDYEIDLSGMI